MSGTKLVFMGFIALIFLIVGLTGKLGSILGAIIDPANMSDQGGGGEAPPIGGNSGEAPPPSGVLTPSQIGFYAQGVGLSGQSQIIAIAIALAESGGRINATHTNTDGSIDRGLWQINSVHKQYSASQLLSSPAYNAKAMYEISSGGRNWYPWATYTSGAYQKYLNEAQAAVKGTLV